MGFNSGFKGLTELPQTDLNQVGLYRRDPGLNFPVIYATGDRGRTAEGPERLDAPYNALPGVW